MRTDTELDATPQGEPSTAGSSSLEHVLHTADLAGSKSAAVSAGAAAVSGVSAAARPMSEKSDEISEEIDEDLIDYVEEDTEITIDAGTGAASAAATTSGATLCLH